MKLMKAIQVSKPGSAFELIQKEIPEPTKDQVMIKILACGVCHGDALVKEGGNYPGLSYPRIPGHEIIGVIDKIGSDVTGYELGQRVGVGWPAGITYDGGFAEYMVTASSELVTIPEELNEVEGAPLLCAGVTTFDALKNSGANPGDVVAIQGVGGLGHLAIQYAKNMGFNTVAISRGSDKKELAEKLGANIFIATEEQDAAKELQKLGGAKVILITAPSSKAVSELASGLGFDGKIIIVAGINDPIEISPNQLLVGRQSIQGWLATDANARKDTINFSILTNVHSMVETFPLEQINSAYEKMMTAKVHFRAVLTME
ncbi:zinc-binding dehydrogenase [Clostridium beijerinckii]|uniref:Alcohol dehydrogenase n=1 Tax=Clostridium beijerinckii TaxID=1520 RepID=A0AAX0B946_CLOBE|nr:zinc-binding dehydrogenase [Clostridium beijerinckii]NRT91920.1 propanol-preferring alcohol dehydrogenase [Clostridium beijerinckii]NYC71446.1 propanol-preferring alcohol dehydrogenase [Clostridium beijerinckii]